MTTIHPPALGPGDAVGVIAPGGPVRPAALRAGLKRLRALGLLPVPGRHLFERRAYLAGDDAHRLADLQTALRDPQLKAIWCARGGYGCHRIVAQADFSRLRASPKAIIGFSDITVLHAAAWRQARLASLHGPMVSQLGDRKAYDEASLRQALSGQPMRFRFGRPTVVGRIGEGPILGGCLSIVTALLGTPFELDLRGAVFFWEEVNEQPFRIDRMLAQLRLAGHLQGLRGMLVGRLVGCKPKRRTDAMPLKTILEAHLAGTDYPVVVDFPAGHTARQVTLPLGRASRLDTQEGVLLMGAAGDIAAGGSRAVSGR